MTVNIQFLHEQFEWAGLPVCSVRIDGVIHMNGAIMDQAILFLQDIAVRKVQ